MAVVRGVIAELIQLIQSLAQGRASPPLDQRPEGNRFIMKHGIIKRA